MPLRWALDSVDRVQPRIEPLRAVRGRHLPAEHVEHFVVEGLRIGF